MNRERLSRLADLLDQIHARELPFNLKGWGGFVMEDGDVLENLNTRNMVHVCGTTACACGHAALDPWFQAQGLYLVAWRSDSDSALPVSSVEDLNTLLTRAKDNDWPDLSFSIQYQDNEGRLSIGWYAIEAFFDIGDETANFLFAEESYVNRATAADVADRIRGLLG